MKINELIITEDQEQLDEISLSGVGKAIGKGASVAGKTIGGAAGGAVQAGKNFWQGMKAGYAGAQQAVAGDGTPAAPAGGAPTAQATPAAQQATPAGGAPAPQQAAPAGGAPAPQQAAPAGQPATPPAGGAPAQQQPAPAASNAELDQLKASIGKLNPDQKKELAGELEKSINAPAPQAAPADQAATPPAGQPKVTQSADATARGQQNKGFGFNNDTGVAFNSQAEKDAWKAQKAQAGSAPTQPATPTGSAPTTAPASTTMSKAQQDALKAKLKGQRAAGKTTASQTGSGFSDYVKGGGGQTLAGADAQGNPIFKQNVKRESVEFHSNFLGMLI